jgi:hypothetical protein
MCMQCVATASVTVGTASGIRAWVQAKAGDRLTPARMRAITIGLLTLGVLAAGIGISGSG